jgi:membrane fusion protein (multidrug efflux system)
MRVKSKIFIFALVLAATAFLFYSCSGSSNAQVKSDEEEETKIPVETAEVIQGSISATYSGSSSLEAEAEALVVAKVSGVVEKIFVEEGNVVRAGQTLAKLDDEQYRLELNQAQSVLEKLANEFDRNESLFKNKIVSQEAYDKSKSEYHTQKAAYDLAKLRLNYTEIKAPITGIVTKRFVKVGNMVKEDQQTFQVTDFDPLLAVLHVPEREMNKLEKDLPAVLKADAVPDSEFKGKILRISPIVDAGTGTFKVTIEVRDKTRRLKPGMFARVQIVYDTHESALLVPKSAILSEDTDTWAFVIADGTVNKRSVNIGYTNSTHVEVVSGLSLDDIIVTTGLNSLKDGSKIKVIEP